MWTQETNLFTSDLTTIRALCLLQETSWSHWCCPPRFVKDACETKGPIILMIINSTLSAGVVPTTLKHAILQPLIKRQKSWNKLYSWSCNLRSPSGVPQEFLRSPSGVPQESLRSSSGVPQESLRSPSGVPQESTLGPMMFSCQLLPLGSVFRNTASRFSCPSQLRMFSWDGAVWVSRMIFDQLTKLLRCV